MIDKFKRTKEQTAALVAGLMLLVGSGCLAIFGSKTPNSVTGQTWAVVLFSKHDGGLRYFTPLSCVAIWAGMAAGVALILWSNMDKPSKPT